VPENYASTVFENDQKVNELFKGMEDDFKMIRPWKLQFGSECTQRAETWTYEMDQVKQIKSQKVFVFYTRAYHEYYRKTQGKKFIWWFHVAPYVLVKNTDGNTEERVLDKVFADSPQNMKDWTDIFIKSKEKCIENVPFASFEGDVTGEGASYNRNAHCYIVRAPMYDMFPGDADARERGTRNELKWDMNEVYYAAKSLPLGERNKFFKRVGL
jgi:hypothetical protein